MNKERLYRKKPVVIEAIQWNGKNRSEIEEFVGDDAVFEGRISFHFPYRLKIITLEGVMNASVGDYIIRGVDGEYYPCREDIFLETYEKV